MVFYFTLTSDPTVTVYMGRDKHENEELIRWGWPEDIWFHVDDLSSAHVYLRMPAGQVWDTLAPEVIEECCQLVKANSIQGCKQNDVRIVYTPWSNLKKTGGMDVGQVGFHKESLRKYHTIFKKDNVAINKLEKTRVEKNDVDYRALREARDDAERQKQRQIDLAEKRRLAEEQAAQKQAAELKSYSSLMDAKKMTTNKEVVPDEDDFM